MSRYVRDEDAPLGTLLVDFDGCPLRRVAGFQPIKTPVGIAQGSGPARGAPSRVGEEQAGEGSGRDRPQAEPRDLDSKAVPPSSLEAAGIAPKVGHRNRACRAIRQAELPASAVLQAREHRT